MAVYDNLRLHETAERFVIEPTPSPSGENQDILVIARLTQEISLSPGGKSVVPASAITRPIYGIFGVIRLVAGPYLIVITKRELVGAISGSNIWKVTGTDVIGYKR